jgi:hypothetical protein
MGSRIFEPVCLKFSKRFLPLRSNKFRRVLLRPLLTNVFKSSAFCPELLIEMPHQKLLCKTPIESKTYANNAVCKF